MKYGMTAMIMLVFFCGCRHEEVLIIKPLFTAAEANACEKILTENYENTADDKVSYTTYYMMTNACMRCFCLEVELWHLANQKLSGLKGRERREFYDSYQKWEQSFHKQLEVMEKKVMDECDSRPGTMETVDAPCRRMKLLEEYLNTFKRPEPELKYNKK